MTAPTVVDPPALPGFRTHYGVQVSLLGDDSDVFIALGRVEKRRALAAFAQMCRADLGFRLGLEAPDVSVDDLSHELWTVATACGDCGGDPDCYVCADIRRADWWLRPAKDGDVAFHATVYEI